MSDRLTADERRRIGTFYDETLTPTLDAVDASRRRVRGVIVKVLLIVLPPIAFLIAGDLLDPLLPFSSSALSVTLGWVWLAASIVFALVRYFLPGAAAYANYRQRFKQDVVSQVFRVVSPSATYDPLQGITAEIFDAPGLFNTRGGFHSDDRVRGRLGETAFEASEVARAYQTGYGKNSRSYEVFRGLFFQVDFRQRLSGVTLVEPAKAPTHQIGEREGLIRMPLDQPAFDKEFTVYTSNEAETRALLTPVLAERLLALRQQAGAPVFVAFKGRRVYVGVHYGRSLFEPGIARSLSKDDVLKIAEQFALVDLVVREVNAPARGSALPPDDSLLEAPGAAAHPLSRLAADKAGTVTTADLVTLAAANIDDSAKDGDAWVPKPERTRIVVEPGPGGLAISYGLGIGFWVMLAMSLIGASVAWSAVRAPHAPEWVAAASAWVRTFPPVPWLDAFAASAPTPWLIVGTVVALLFALPATGYVRRVVVERDRILISRGLRPFPRVYRRPEYGRVIRINTALYITKTSGLHLMNPTASPPMIREDEARWLTSELKRVLQAGLS